MQTTIDSLDSLPPFFTIPEFAARLKISRAKTYELLSSGELKSVKLGRCRRIPRLAVLRFEETLAAGDLPE